MDRVVQEKSLLVNQAQSGMRLDIVLSSALPDYSRSFFKNLITEGNVLVDGKEQTKAGYIVEEHEVITILIPDFLASKQAKDVSTIDAHVVFEHPDFLIINKGAGVLVHAPNDKCDQLTLVDWLIQRFKEIADVGIAERPGIVHRLDMDTSGLMIVPRTNYAHNVFGDMFKDRQIHKTYLALVEGHPSQEGSIDFAIARHPVVKTKMTHVPHKDISRYAGARNAHTHYQVIQYFERHSLISVKPTTGRTHQIRVHCAAIGHPLVGDCTYGQSSTLLARHALHAAGLEFIYKGQHFMFEQEMPVDMRSAIGMLQPYQF